MINNYEKIINVSHLKFSPDVLECALRKVPQSIWIFTLLISVKYYNSIVKIIFMLRTVPYF